MELAMKNHRTQPRAFDKIALDQAVIEVDGYPTVCDAADVPGLLERRPDAKVLEATADTAGSIYRTVASE